ncbi:hypothetical protein SORBI_3001G115200, partial [Sorghum bicolor]
PEGATKAIVRIRQNYEKAHMSADACTNIDACLIIICYIQAQGPKFNLLELAGAARTRTPSTTNYDVHSPSWGDGRPARPPSAMWATGLGHGPA